MQLKKILENLDKMPSTVKGLTSGLDDKPKLTTEQKRKLREMVSKYNELGDALRHEQKIVDVANALSEISELAETYACNESADWFQTETIKRDFTRVKKTATDFKKIAKECYSNMQQLGALFDDAGQTLSRYFEISDPMMEVNPNPMDIKSQENLPINGPIQEVSPNDKNIKSQRELPSGGPATPQIKEVTPNNKNLQSQRDIPGKNGPATPQIKEVTPNNKNIKAQYNLPAGGPAPKQIKEVSPNTSNLQSQKDLPSGGPTKCQCPTPTNPSVPVKPAGTGEVNIKQERDIPQGGPAPAQIKEVAPKGWEGTVKAMKKHPEVDNPWKLSNWMKQQGYTHHK